MWKNVRRFMHGVSRGLLNILPDILLTIGIAGEMIMLMIEIAILYIGHKCGW